MKSQEFIEKRIKALDKLRKEALKEYQEKLDNGESFEDLAKEFSKDGSGSLGGSLGEFYSGQMVPEFENALLELSIDEISNPVKSQFGYHIIKLEDKSVERENTYENYKDDIQRNLKMSKQQEEYFNKTMKKNKVWTIAIHTGDIV